MVQSSDIILSIIALAISFYGGISRDVASMALGILLIFVTIALRFKTQEEEINLLKSEINTYYELQKIWMELERLKYAKSK